ncbi:tRNA 2-selenouridine(34) synthase MnmH [Mucilaginibacter sp. CSA2-8R]|uniref:tRNA 2-selenouridine(34) synthase MnmH n=1 Tax=Mucilaginibacter sp. CSA2-8R TaxID=3141542 RepID=UPI00315DF30E
MSRSVTITEYFDLPETVPLIDVRTPAEFEHGHVPGAFNIPLFTNEERVKVGTTYKQQSREDAILLGFDLTGNKWSGFIRTVLQIAPQKKVAVHCWRGGMRSGAMAWALGLYGFEVYLIQGGYKNYRRWVLQQFNTPYKLLVLGGMTGSGKTHILHQLASQHQQVINLEDLAQHQGSSYGTLNKMVQPTQEQFENNLAQQLHRQNKVQPIWLEDESQTIGKRFIPKPLWVQMRQSVLINLQVPHEERITALATEYGSLDKAFLITCTERIHKRLGPEQTKHAIAAIQENRMEDFVRLVLVYYDKTYRAGLSKREQGMVFNIQADSNDAVHNAKLSLNFVNQNASLHKA